MPSHTHTRTLTLHFLEVHFLEGKRIVELEILKKMNTKTIASKIYLNCTDFYWRFGSTLHGKNITFKLDGAMHTHTFREPERQNKKKKE